jgi:hypothetical protein
VRISLRRSRTLALPFMQLELVEAEGASKLHGSLPRAPR